MHIQFTTRLPMSFQCGEKIVSIPEGAPVTIKHFNRHKGRVLIDYGHGITQWRDQHFLERWFLMTSTDMPINVDALHDQHTPSIRRVNA